MTDSIAIYSYNDPATILIQSYDDTSDVTITSYEEDSSILITEAGTTPGPRGPAGSISGLYFAADYDNLADCISSLGLVDNINLVISREEAIDFDIPSNYHLIFLSGGYLTLGATSITIPNTITAGMTQIFNQSSTGQVTLLNQQYVYPEWWGATSSTDYALPTTYALASCSSPTVILPNELILWLSEVALPSNSTLLGGPETKLYDPDYATVVVPPAPAISHRFITATSVENIVIKNIKIYGDNATFMNTEGGYPNPGLGAFSDNAALVLETVSNGLVENVHVKYTFDAIMSHECSDCLITHCSTAGDPYLGMGGGIMLLNCNRSHIEYCHVMDSSDGSLFIYNGHYCSITHCVVECTESDSIKAVGCGMESCYGCVISDTTAYHCWMGFQMLEMVKDGTIKNCLATHCHVGFYLGTFGPYYSGVFDVTIEGNRVINCQKYNDIMEGEYKISGYLIRSGGYKDLYDTGDTHNIRFTGNYFGDSNDGVGLVVENISEGLYANIGNLIVSNNIFEAFTYNLAELTSKDTGKKILDVSDLNSGIFTNNYFITQADIDDTTSQLVFARTKNIIFSDNRVISKIGPHNLLELDDDCSNFKIDNNFFSSGAVDLSRISIWLRGINHTVTNNTFMYNYSPMIVDSVQNCKISNNNAPELTTLFFSPLGTSTNCIFSGNQNLVGQCDFFFLSTYTLMQTGWQGILFIATETISTTLPPATVMLQYEFFCTGPYFYLILASGERFRNSSADYYMALSTGQTVKLICVEDGIWDILSFGTGSETYIAP